MRQVEITPSHRTKNQDASPVGKCLWTKKKTVQKGEIASETTLFGRTADCEPPAPSESRSTPKGSGVIT